MEKSEVISGLGALAQETRLDIVRFLVRKGSDGASAGSIGEHVRVPSATLAFHLNILTGAGLLNRRRSGRNIFYTVAFGHLHGMTAYLLDNCCVDAGTALAGAASCAAGELTDLDNYRAPARSPAKRRRT